jgi:hypothetical protein
VLRFVDGGEQRFRRAAALCHWTVRLELLDDAELRGFEEFFDDRQGAFGTFRFVDPWNAAEYADCSFDSDRLETERSGEWQSRAQIVIRQNRV